MALHHARHCQFIENFFAEDVESVEDGSYSDYDDDDSVLSENISASNNDPRRPHPTAQKDRSLREKWMDLERQFAHRDRLLNRISNGHSRRYLQTVRQREENVRIQAFQRLLNGASSDHTDDRWIYQKLLVERELDFRKNYAKRKQTPWSFVESNFTLPAMFSLLIHSMAYCGFWDAMHAVLSFVLRCLNLERSTLYTMSFFVGLLLLRVTGDLYWFLPDSDYDCIKFDLHNRCRLGYWDARILSAVRPRKILRLTLFMVADYLCYVSTSVFQGHIHGLLLHPAHEIAAHLPSVENQEKNGMCYDFHESVCSTACQNEIERQEEEYLYFRQQDLIYTWKKMSQDSYDMYWHAWVQRMFDDNETTTAPPNIFRNHHMYCFASMLIASVILRLVGFKVWHKYC